MLLSRPLFLFLILFVFFPFGMGSVQAVSQPVRASQGMVVSSNALSSQVGVQILKDGGNAVDAAVAVAFSMAVFRPCERFPGSTMTRIRESASAAELRVLSVRSVDPASTITISSAGRVWFASESRNASIDASSLKTVVMTETG